MDVLSLVGVILAFVAILGGGAWLAKDLAGEDKKPAYQAKVDRYEKEKNEIKAQAEAIEKESKDWDSKSDAQMHLHHRWAQATTALQISIALAAIALRPEVLSVSLVYEYSGPDAPAPDTGNDYRAWRGSLDTRAAA